MRVSQCRGGCPGPAKGVRGNYSQSARAAEEGGGKAVQAARAQHAARLVSHADSIVDWPNP
jgi:hypothetical protein